MDRAVKPLSYRQPGMESPPRLRQKNEKSWVDIQEFIAGKVCRRVILDEVMDGWMNRQRCEEGEEACDVCDAREEECRRQVVRDRIIDGFDDFQDSGDILDESGELSSRPEHPHEPPSSPPRLELEFPSKRRRYGIGGGKELEVRQQEQERR
jgi:hypothetical protein